MSGINKDGLMYVWIPPGSFQMGCSPGDECAEWERPAHQVSISKGFWMGQTVVTVGGYKRMAQANSKPMPPEPKNSSGRPMNVGWADDKMPMISVTWDEAQEYCTWAGGRLPTEAEWEYAARAGSTETRYGPIDEIAWYADNSGNDRLNSAQIWNSDPSSYAIRLDENRNRTHEVGQKLPNRFGLYDMLGNVVAWTSDWWDPNYYQKSSGEDPTGPSTGRLRVMRGVSWFGGSNLVRVSVRVGGGPDVRHPTGGFRCVVEKLNP
jgi:formylglycine-generating enzyme required for sulfatase activity